MVVFHNDIINAIAQARNIRHLLASDILERWQQGEEATAEQTQSLIQLGDWIDFLTDSEQLIVEDCIDSTDVWNIIQKIGEQAIGLDCVGTNYNYNNPPPTPTPNVFNYVESVTGLNTNNADPQNPVVRISVDNSTITGDGTPASPLVASIPPSGVQSVTDDGNGVVSVDNTDPVNPIVKFNGINVDPLTLSGDGTSGSPLTVIGGGGGGGSVTSVSATAGAGVSVSVSNPTTTPNITVTNTDTGSAQNIFKNVAVAGNSTIVADNNDDTLTLQAGTAISISTNATTDTIRIENTAPDQTVVLNAGTGIGVSGTYPNFTISNTSMGGGGSAVSYYLNGSVSQGIIGGNTYYQMSKIANTGAAANFTIGADGYIAQFLTDAGDPALLNIPAGNWDFQIYFSASSTGGSPRFYTELYKYDGTTFTLISSGSLAPQNISNGTFADVYSSTLTIPATSLTITDRLAIRVYVIHSGRTITMYTQDSRLAEVHTTFSTGITALNGLTPQVQSFAVGTSGTDFGINSSGSTHTFNLPTASATNRGALSSANWSTFNGKQDAITGAATTITSSDLTASRALVSDASGKVGVSTVTSSTLAFLDATSSVQTQLNGKEATITNLPINKGGTNSTTALNNNRVMRSSGGAIVEAAAITAARALKSDANGLPVHFDTATEPSLTELSYVKGVTSAIQTQLNNVGTLSIECISGTITSPADLTTYFWCIGGTFLTAATVSTGQGSKFAYAFEITGITIRMTMTTNGSAEDSTLYLRNITTSTSTLMGTFKTNGNLAYTNITGLAISCNTTDEYCLEMRSPNWATNPINLRLTASLFLRRT